MRIVAAALLLGAVSAWSPWDDVLASLGIAPKQSVVLETLPNYYGSISVAKPLHVRAKRAIFAAVGYSGMCEPGWTGLYCENPICTNKTDATPSPGPTVLIELLVLKGSCSGAYYVPIDYDAADNLQIHVAATGNPYINLTAPDGTIAAPASTFVEDGYSLTAYSMIKPGGYSLTIDNQNTPTTECQIEVNSYSSLKVASGFVYQPQDDFPPNGESAVDGVPMYFISHTTKSAETLAVTIRPGTSLTPVYRSTLTKRYGCGFENYAGQFTCNLGTMYFFHVEGVDSYGYKFRRTNRITCLQQLTTPTQNPPTTQAPITNCYNNGTLLRPIGGQNTCFCTELFTGPQCEKANCMNGGFPEPDIGLNCLCPDGWHGTNCQDVTCPVDWEPYLTDYKTMVVILRDTVSMNQYRGTIAAAILNELTQLEQSNTEVYRGFILVKFGNNTYETNYYPVFSQDAFITDITKVSTAVGGCNDTIFDPIASIYNLAIYDKSPVYIFTDAVALDANNWTTITEYNTRVKLPMYTFFLAQDGCPLDVLDPGFRAIQSAAYFTAGLVFFPSPDIFSMTIQTVIKGTTYKMNQVLVDDLNQCSTPSYRVFFVDSSTTDLVIFAVGENLVVGLIDPNGATNTLSPIVQSGSTYFYEIIKPVVGEHLLSVSASNPNNFCSFRVNARSEYDLFLGTSQFVNDDASDSEPVVGEPVHFVAQLTGLKENVKDPFRLFSELTITTNINNDNMYQKPMYYSSGKYRSGCGFHLYFGVSNFCEFNTQPFYATVYADDGKGFTIQRTTIGYCSLSPITPYPPNTCQNGGVFDPQNNSTCICPPNFHGNFCEKIICNNGGTPAGSYCLCPSGTGGFFCEQYACPIVNIDPDTSFTGRSMAFVVSARTSMQTAINLIAATAQNFVRDVQSQNPNFIRNWIVIAVNSQNYTLLTSSSKPSDFVSALNNLAANLSQFVVPVEPSPQVQLEQAMLGAALISERRSSIWVFADSDGPDDASYIQLFDTAQEFQLTLNLVGTGNKITTAPENNGQFPEYLRSLATSTYGDTYMTAKLDQIMFFIVSLYKSGVSSQYFVDDCTKPISYYMPIDGWTQSFTVAITGPDLNSVTLNLPDGTPARMTDYELVSINDPELKLNQYITACEGIWALRQQNCFQFDFTKMAWLDGWSFCHNQNAYYVQIDNADTNTFIRTQVGNNRAWIGLVWNAGQWFWDVPDGIQSQPLTGYTNWANGTDPTKPAYNYVVMNADGFWEPAPISELNYPACQKHRYGQGVFPGETANLVPGGLWKVTVLANTGSCTIQARSQSEIQVFFGFVQDPHTDYPELYANIQSNSNYLVALPTYISPFSPDTNPSMEGRLNYALLSSNGTVVKSLPLSDRWACGYPFISTAFGCPQNDAYISDVSVKFSGLDQYGFSFERYFEAVCTRYIASCANGGFANNGQCVCRPGWAGNTCRTPICQNKGYESAGVCVCPGQFSGTFCENAKCEPPYPKHFKDDARTLVIALETSYNMGATIFQLKRSLQAALDAVNNDPSTVGWFSNFILYPFDSTSNKKDWYPVVKSASTADIVAAVKNISTMSCPGNAPCASTCPRPIVGVLQDILSMTEFTSPNSVILVITRATPEDYTSVGQIAQKLQEAKPYINFIYPAIDSPCSQGWNTPQVESVYRIVGYSQGSVFTLMPSDIVTSFIPKYIPTLFSSAGIGGSNNNCTYDEILFQVEHAMFEFTIDYYHPGMETMKVYDPLGNQMILPDSIISSDSNIIVIVPVNDTGATRAGTYRAVISGSGGNTCYLNVRGRSSLEIYLGFVDSAADQFGGATVDNAHYAPVILENNTIVVHAEALGNGAMRYVQIVAPLYGLIHTVELRRRDTQCSYEWYSTIPFPYDYDTMLVIVYGRDERGAYFNRNFQVTAVGTRPYSPPPPAYCDLTKVYQDTVFMIDGSMKSSEVTFNLLKQFAIQATQPYSFSDQKTKAGTVLVADKAYPGFLLNVQQNSHNQVSTLITNLAAPNVAGQNVTDVLQNIMDSYTGGMQGYRNTTDVRHLLVYVTNTNPTDSDPSVLVESVKGMFDLIVITFDMQPSQALTNMVSRRCYYYSTDFHDLMNYGINFVQLQSCYGWHPCSF